MRKPDFRICENKDADHSEADQRFCFCYKDSTISLLPKSEILKPLAIFLWLHSTVCVRPDLKPRRPVFSQ